jgi:glycosyltransferase involved in cell wall biosynthesis
LVVACHSYYPAVGGVERLVQGLVEELVRRGTDATVVTRQEPGTARQEMVAGVRVIRLPMRRVGRFHVPRGYLRTLRELRPDVFHLSGNRVWCADFYLPWAGRFDWPQVMTGHGFYQYEMHRRLWDRWYFERYLPGRIRRLDLYTPITGHERDQLLGWGVAANQLDLIPNGIALDEVQGPRTSPTEVRSHWGLRTPFVGVYVGGFYENKRVDRLVRAVAATRGRWGLVAAGRDLPGSRYDRSTVARLGAELDANLVLQDVLPRSDVLDGLNAADVAVLGSSYEGFGLFLLEAMAMGRPFVAFRTGAAPELAATGAGICVDTEEEFTAALNRLEDEGTRRGMGARGREAVRDFSVARQAARYLAAYERAIEHRTGASGTAPPRPSPVVA